MKLMTKLVCVPLIFSLSGCATTGRGTALGAAIGAGTGLAISSQSGGTNEQRVTSAAVGALAGGLIGYFATKDKIKREQIRNLEAPGNLFTPRIKRPEVRKIWVPDEIVGDEYIQGHWKFLIDRPAVWTKEN